MILQKTQYNTTDGMLCIISANESEIFDIKQALYLYRNHLSTEARPTEKVDTLLQALEA